MLIAQHFTTFLAAASPDASSIGNGILFLLVLCPIVGVVVSIIFGVIAARNASRRNPPIGEEMYKQFILRTEANAHVERVDSRVSEAFSEITNLRNHTDGEISAIRSNMTKAYGDFERALGRIEGKLDQKK